MANEKVISILSALKKCYLGEIVDALDFAIEAVKAQEGNAEGGMNMEQITLRQFLREKTNVCELCVIREDGWIVACAWIDNEDLFAGSIPPRLDEMLVKEDRWGNITILDATGKSQNVPCHYIDV